MESYKYISSLDAIPIDHKYRHMGYKDTLVTLLDRQTDDCFIEVGIASEIGLVSLFENRNVPDSLQMAFKDSFRNTDTSLYETYLEKTELGEGSVRGFINNLKGKIFEYELPDKLEEVYPGYEFNIAENVTQPIWDIEAVDLDGANDFLIQAKMWADSSNNIGKLTDLMESNPDVLYATSSEIRNAVLERAPELSDQFVPDIDVANFEFTEEVKENLELLVDNLGIDVPDELGEFLPYVTEIILGIRLIMDLIKVQKDFKHVDATNKAKLSAVKVIVLFSRFGITTVLTTAGGAAGSALGPIGSLGGGLVGAFSSAKLNKVLKPKFIELSLALVGLEEEDLFYFRNKEDIDDLASNFIKNQEILNLK